MNVKSLLFSGACVGRAQSLGLLVLRLVFGASLLRIGWFKISNLEGLRGMWSDPTGFLGNEVSMWLLIFAEVGCAALVAIGFLTRLSAIPVVIAMSDLTPPKWTPLNRPGRARMFRWRSGSAVRSRRSRRRMRCGWCGSSAASRRRRGGST